MTPVLLHIYKGIQRMATLRSPGLKVKLLVGPTCKFPRSTKRSERSGIRQIPKMCQEQFCHFFGITQTTSSIWMFPRIGVPQNGWFIKWMIWGYHYFWSATHIRFRTSYPKFGTLPQKSLAFSHPKPTGTGEWNTGDATLRGFFGPQSHP